MKALSYINGRILTFLFMCNIAFYLSEEAFYIQWGLIETKETLLNEGQSLIFKIKSGEGKIEYVSPIKRKIEFENLSEVITMTARDTRFLNMLGLFGPRQKWFWENHPFFVVESELHFDTIDAARATLVETNTKEKVFSSDGYVIIYFDNVIKQKSIYFHRYYINGKPMKNLKGFDNSRIKVVGSK